MKEQPTQPQMPVMLQYAKEAIATAGETIEAEFNRSANTWLECVGSKIFVIETYLDSDKVKAALGEPKYEEIMSRLERLKERHYELKQIYPDKETVPPVEIKKELLEMIDVLK